MSARAVYTEFLYSKFKGKEWPLDFNRVTCENQNLHVKF